VRGLLVDYGVGNLHSVRRGFERAGARLRIASKPSAQAIARADFLVLPGVGAFSAGVRGIAAVRKPLREALEQGKPALGICLGMQLLFDRSGEGPGRGLRFIEGDVERLQHATLPHVGWNEVVPAKDDPLLDGLREPFHAYYVNSFAPAPAARGAVIARTRYGKPFAAGVRRLNTWGVQFHPEKSSSAGLRIIGNFVGVAEDLA
jgi:imidazole glycerol-phosphate synthase subunit HisH